MNGRQRAAKSYGLAQFFKCQVGLTPQQRSHLLLVASQNLGLTPGKVVAWLDVPGLPALLQKFFDHAQRNSIPRGNIQASALFAIV